MHQFFSSLFSKPKNLVKIFEGQDIPMPNFQVTATHVRVGQTPRNYRLDDGSKLVSLVGKWQFEPGGRIERCGYDYQIQFVNGDCQMQISICFSCKTLTVDHTQVFKTSKKRIRALLEADFTPL